jgi:hypothetical protein
MNQQENNKPTISKDLTVNEAQQDEVIGGSPRTAGGGALLNVDGRNTW